MGDNLLMKTRVFHDSGCVYLIFYILDLCSCSLYTERVGLPVSIKSPDVE
jgi:hypothetical protein